MAKPFLANPFLVTAVGAFLAVSAAPALADENKLLNIEPLSSAELLAEKGENLGGALQTADGDPLRRRRPGVRIAIEGGQNNATMRSGQAGQINSTSLTATNDLVSIRNVAGSVGGAANAGARLGGGG